MGLPRLKAMIIENDSNVLKLLNTRLKSKTNYQLIKAITHLGDGTMAVLYCVIALMLQKTYDVMIGYLLIVSLGLSQLIVHSLKRFVNRKRPYIKHELSLFESPPSCKYSLPSGHTACAITVALSFALYVPSVAFIFYTLAIFVSLSRVILGYHYPTDIIIGALISFLSHYISLIHLNIY